MKIKVYTFLIALFITLSASAEDTIPTKRQHFIAVHQAGGFVVPSKNIAPGGYKSPSYSALSLKYGFSARGDKWSDFAYGMPYRGVGFYLPSFSRKRDLGEPFSLFLFQGAQLKEISTVLSVDYEINLGISFNWNHYDPVERPRLLAFGSSTNVHLGGSWYFKWRMSRRFDLHSGVSITHFSNGALRTPNNGLNTLSAFVELAYHFNREEKREKKLNTFAPPAFEKNTAHDLSFMVTSRTLKVDTVGTNLASKYPKYRFTVAGISYSYMLHNTRRFKWGPSLEVVYDESANIQAWREENAETKGFTDHIKYGKMADRFSAGLSLKGELAMPGYSIFAQMGYDFLHPDKRDKRFYHIYGLKVYLTDNLFASFGVRSTNLTRSQYLSLNIGYTFRQFRNKKGGK